MTTIQNRRSRRHQAQPSVTVHFRPCGGRDVACPAVLARQRNGVGLGDLGEIARIEILEGPQGELFGKNNDAGVINIVTQRPMAATHLNPPQLAKQQCLGVPIFGVDSRVVDPITLAELPPGEVGEIVIHGPQVMLRYWKKPEDTARTLVQIDGRRFLRTGDLARVDADGFFFMVERIKRMINASGFKVWPSEVETLMYQHPSVLEACVIGAKDTYRGETVKALIVLRPDYRGRVTAEELLGWCREHMAAYKVPRVVDFVGSLPKSGSGKIQWRELQEREMTAASRT